MNSLVVLEVIHELNSSTVPMLDLYETVLQTYLSIAGPSIYFDLICSPKNPQNPMAFFRGTARSENIFMCSTHIGRIPYPWIGRGHLDHPRFFPGFVRSWESGKQTTSKNKEKTLHQKKGYIAKTPQPDLEDSFRIMSQLSNCFWMSFAFLRVWYLGRCYRWYEFPGI